MESVRYIVGSFLLTVIAFVVLSAAVGRPFWPALVGFVITVGYGADFARGLGRSNR